MKTVYTYDEFLNEGRLGRGLATAALAGTLLTSPMGVSGQEPPPTEQTQEISNEKVETNIAVTNLINSNYKYDGYDLNSDGSTTIYFTNKNISVVLDCISNQKWNGNGSFIKFMIKNSILK